MNFLFNFSFKEEKLNMCGIIPTFTTRGAAANCELK